MTSVNLTNRTNLFLGLFCLISGLILMFVWIPLDTDTGIVERSRGKYVVGDALAPIVAAVILLISAVMLLLIEVRRPNTGNLTRANIKHIGAVILCIAIGTAIMRWVGPVVVEGITGEEYRFLRDTTPWKLIGFSLGGLVIVAGLIMLVERRFSYMAILIGLVAVVGIILIYDLPFEDLLLPPNGDV